MNFLNDSWNSSDYQWRRFANESINRRWASNFGFIDIDKRQGSPSVPQDSDGSPFQLVWLRNLDRLIEMTPVSFDPARYFFMDVGCGNGLATIYSADHYPFSQFVGIDYDSDLVSLSNQNLQLFRNRSGSHANIAFFVDDARHYTVPNVPAFIFMYNPFGFSTARTFFERNFEILTDNNSYVAISYDVWVDDLLRMGIHANHVRDPFNNLSLIEFAR